MGDSCTQAQRIGPAAFVACIGLVLPDATLSQDELDGPLDEQEVETIIVTGTRIVRPGIDTIYPAIILGIEEIEDGAFANVADALNEVPSFGQAQTPNFGQSTATVGQNFVNYLGFGTQRTLTLVNGRRFVSAHAPTSSSSGLEVDLNVIPTALVERVETIGIGGAPIYGSDAMSGTVNVILKDRFEGIQLRLRRGTTKDGGGDTAEVSLVGGANFSDDRGNITLSMESHTQDGLVFNDRPQYVFNDPFWGDPELRDPNDPDGTLVSRIYFNHHLNLFSDGGLIDPVGFTIPSLGIGAMQDGNFWQFDSESNLVPFTPGAPFPGSPFFAVGGDGSDLFDNTSQIRSPLNREVFMTTLDYDLTDRVTFSADVLFSNTWADRLVAQSALSTWVFDTAFRFPADHPFLHPDARTLLAGMGASEFWLHRNNADITDGSSEREQYLWHATAGLEGSFDTENRSFNWSIWATHGESDANTSTEALNFPRFLNAVGVRQLSASDLANVDADPGTAEQLILGFSGTASAGVGDIVCESVYQAALGNITGTSGSGVTDSDLPFVQGCVPLNLFGKGARSDAARDWVTVDMLSQTNIEQSVFNLNFGGELIRLPAGWSSFNLGYEFRDEAAFWVPGSGLETGLGRSPPQIGTGGTYTTNEFYGEIAIPLINTDMGLPFMRFAELSGAARRIDHSTAGSDTVWTAGVRFSPVQDLSFRASYTASVRAPSIAELFSPPETARAGGIGTDPCDFRNVNDGRVPDTRLANCVADIPNYDSSMWISNVSTPAIRDIGITRGNPDLANESAESYAIGLTLEPSWIDNLILTADYINVDLTDAIGRVGLSWMLRSCYDALDFPNVPTCSRFTRDDAGQIIDFTGGHFNAATGHYESIQISGAYTFDVATLFSSFSEHWRSRDLGQFETRFRVDHPLERSFSLVGEPSGVSIGSYSDPEWSGTVDFIWSGENTRIFWRVLWQNAVLLDPEGDDLYEDLNGNLIDSIDAPIFNNMTVSHNLARFFPGGPKETTVQFAVGNIFDADLDVYQHASTIGGIPVLLGRTYNLTLQGNW